MNETEVQRTIHDRDIAAAAARAAPVYDANLWRWGPIDGTPDAGDIALALRRMFERVTGTDPATWTETGRLLVTYDEEGDRVRFFLELGTVDLAPAEKA